MHEMPIAFLFGYIIKVLGVCSYLSTMCDHGLSYSQVLGVPLWHGGHNYSSVDLTERRKSNLCFWTELLEKVEDLGNNIRLSPWGIWVIIYASHPGGSG